MAEENRKTVAVLTPTYNRGKLLERLYQSLCNQTNNDFVWYVIDDGSSDNTKNIVKTYIADNVIGIKYFSLCSH